MRKVIITAAVTAAVSFAIQAQAARQDQPTRSSDLARVGWFCTSLNRAPKIDEPFITCATTAKTKRFTVVILTRRYTEVSQNGVRRFYLSPVSG